jgi:hypothetical protein
MESNVSYTVPTADEAGLLAQAKLFEPPPPLGFQGHCNRCGYAGVVYRGRYGGQRCAVCFGLQNGYMPPGIL